MTHDSARRVSKPGSLSPRRKRRRSPTSNPSVNSRGCETLDALFGVAYDGTTLDPDPQLGNFGQLYERLPCSLFLTLDLAICAAPCDEVLGTQARMEKKTLQTH